MYLFKEEEDVFETSCKEEGGDKKSFKESMEEVLALIDEMEKSEILLYFETALCLSEEEALARYEKLDEKEKELILEDITLLTQLLRDINNYSIKDSVEKDRKWLFEKETWRDSSTQASFRARQGLRVDLSENNKYLSLN